MGYGYIYNVQCELLIIINLTRTALLILGLLWTGVALATKLKQLLIMGMTVGSLVPNNRPRELDQKEPEIALRVLEVHPRLIKDKRVKSAVATRRCRGGTA